MASKTKCCVWSWLSVIGMITTLLAAAVQADNAAAPGMALDQGKRSCIQDVDGYAYLSEDMTLSETRSAAFANAKRHAVEMAKTHIKSKTKMSDFIVEYDTVWSDAEGDVTVLEQKDIGVEDNTRYHVWIKAEVNYTFKPKKAAASPQTAPSSSTAARKISVMSKDAPLTVSVWTPKKEYREGEMIEVFIQGNRNFYARIVDVTASGEIIQLLPNDFRNTNFFKANTRYKVPDREDQFTLQVSPPFGEDKIIAYVSEMPLGSVELEPIGQGLSRYKGSSKQFATQSRGISIVSKNTTVEAADAPPLPQSADFFETSWVIKTRK